MFMIRLKHSIHLLLTWNFLNGEKHVESGRAAARSFSLTEKYRESFIKIFIEVWYYSQQNWYFPIGFLLYFLKITSRLPGTS